VCTQGCTQGCTQMERGGEARGGGRAATACLPLPPCRRCRQDTPAQPSSTLIAMLHPAVSEGRFQACVCAHQQASKKAGRRTWAWGHQDACRVHRFDLLNCLLIVGKNNVLAAKVAQVLQGRQYRPAVQACSTGRSCRGMGVRAAAWERLQRLQRAVGLLCTTCGNVQAWPACHTSKGASTHPPGRGCK
jgi:hypothetical protein